MAFKFEPVHDKTNKMTYASSKDSDQPADLHSLTGVFTWHSVYCQPRSQRFFRMTAKTQITDCPDVQADLSHSLLYTHHFIDLSVPSSCLVSLHNYNMIFNQNF